MFHRFGKYLTQKGCKLLLRSQFTVTDTPNKTPTNKTQQIKLDNQNYFKTSAWRSVRESNDRVGLLIPERNTAHLAIVMILIDFLVKGIIVRVNPNPPRGSGIHQVGSCVCTLPLHLSSQ